MANVTTSELHLYLLSYLCILTRLSLLLVAKGGVLTREKQTHRKEPDKGQYLNMGQPF